MKNQTMSQFTKALTLVTLCALSISAGAKTSQRSIQATSDAKTVVTYLTKQAQRDLKGLASCFQGGVREKMQEMEDAYGGRHSPEVPNISVAKLSEEIYRAPAKYCAGLDKNMKHTENESEQVYQACTTNDVATYISTLNFSFSTTGTFGDDGLAYKVNIETTSTLIVKKDADAFPEESDIISSSSKTHVTCDPIRL